MSLRRWRQRRALRNGPPLAAADPPPADPPVTDDPSVVDEVRHCWPLGHFYSPVPDTPALSREPTRSRIWPAQPRECVDLDWREAEQKALLRELGEQEQLTFATEETADPTEYHLTNPNFAGVDGWALQAMIRHLRPARMIEVGGGYSSLLTARINRDCLAGAMDFTSIEPYPPEFLVDGIEGITRLVPSQVQEIPLSEFLALGERDVLFIDSSHVIKTGGDVQYLFHEVIPRLHPGVVVHLHDIFLPADYPESWVMDGRSWNEQYLLRSFLAFNDTFEILLACAWLIHLHNDALVDAVPEVVRTAGGGGSFWFRRKPGS